jgi:mannose-6-phosphate isomerase
VSAALAAALRAPLRFTPVYKPLVWGGRRMERWRGGLPDGPVGESWDLADHADGMSVVAEGPLAGQPLAALVAGAGPDLVGAGFAGGPFPLMVKLIDAAQRLSVQVHPDDALARALGVGNNGKTECWRVLADGGAIYQGTQPGIDRPAFERALAAGEVAGTLNRYDPQAGDFFFLEARTVHALGEGCLVYEVQQTSNITFRVYDWGRVGLDGKPRPLHVRESLDTIDFARTGFGPQRPAFATDARGGQTRSLCSCAYFTLDEWRGDSFTAAASGRCAVLVCLEGEAAVETSGGEVTLAAMQTALVPAAAGGFRVRGTGAGARAPAGAGAGAAAGLLIAEPRL